MQDDWAKLAPMTVAQVRECIEGEGGQVTDILDSTNSDDPIARGLIRATYIDSAGQNQYFRIAGKR